MSTELKQVNKLKKTARRNDNLNDNKFIERLIKISRVTKVTKGGKKLRERIKKSMSESKEKLKLPRKMIKYIRVLINN
jgi:hypothetical protein